eukprot:scaffold155320_cov33-Cyclotella_meneghiniana.AAC.1
MARVVAGATITSRGAASGVARTLGLLVIVVIDVMGSVLVGGLLGISVATRTLAVVSPTIVVASTATIASTASTIVAAIVASVVITITTVSVVSAAST